MTSFEFWEKTHTSPYHFPMNECIWNQSMFEDTDSDGRKLFDTIKLTCVPGGMIQYGCTAFGFDEAGAISDQVHYSVIRDFAFDDSEVGQTLLKEAMATLEPEKRIYAFFHYFGMSACARHGKLHESQTHIHSLLIKSGFAVEHENVYYSRTLCADTPQFDDVTLIWKELNDGSCREFAAQVDDREVCWGQVHFLPQGNIAYLRWIYTDSSRQHEGIGTKVMYALCSNLYNMGIQRFDTDTASGNIPAQRFYEKCGFRNEGITRSYHT